MSLKCGWCEIEIAEPSSAQVGHANAGRNVFCSKACKAAHGNHNWAGLLKGPCPTCGRMFRSKTRTKTFCSMKCYTQSPAFRERMASYNEHKRLPEGACAQCGKEGIPRNRKFCSATCRRTYFAERFDRWVANPEAIALPQCYDEFLTQEELPCLVQGCEWVGKFLGAHVNHVHGITARQFKELAGFNLKSGLVSVDLRKHFEERTRARLADGTLNIGNPDRDVTKAVPVTKYRSLEGKEHGIKARAIMAVGGAQRPPVPCRVCGKPTEQPVTGSRYYCSTMCRSRYYTRKNKAELACSFCGTAFMANRAQVLRAQKELPVCCSTNCRNRMNMVACLATRGIEWTP